MKATLNQEPDSINANKTASIDSITRDSNNEKEKTVSDTKMWISEIKENTEATSKISWDLNSKKQW